MLRYLDTKVVFSEIPDEITLAINITNCPCGCVGCHSSYLSEDTGNVLSIDVVIELILKNLGITCICFMGGDREPEEVNKIATSLRILFSHIKIGWYSGRDSLSKEINLDYFDFIKIGSYKEELGGLNHKTTNQRLFLVNKNILTDITYRFQEASL